MSPFGALLTSKVPNFRLLAKKSKKASFSRILEKLRNRGPRKSGVFLPLFAKSAENGVSILEESRVFQKKSRF